MGKFAGDLNVHKNPNVSKPTNFNTIADKLSSLDYNFLKLNHSEQPFISKSSKSVSIYIPEFVNVNVFSSKIK